MPTAVACRICTTALPKSVSSFASAQEHVSPPTPVAIPRDVQSAAALRGPSDCPSVAGPPIFCDCHNTQTSPCSRMCLWTLRAGKQQTVTPQPSTRDTQVSVPPPDPTVTHKHGWRAHKHLYCRVASKAVMWPTSQGCCRDYSMMLPMHP